MSLTEMSYYARKFAPVATIALLVLLVFYFAFQLFFMYLSAQQKAAEEARKKINPNLKLTFEKIKRPVFKDAQSSNKVPVYILDTIEGVPINATDSAKIAFIPNKAAGFGFLQKIYFMAQEVGIDTEVTKHKLTDEKTATFYNGLRSLTIDISNFNFNYQFTMSKDNINLVNGTVAQTASLENKAIEFLRSIGRYPEELARGKKNINYYNLNIDTKELTPVNDIEQANMAEVDFFLPEIDKIPSVSPKYFNSPHFVIVAFTDKGLQVVRAQVKYYERSKEQTGVYPLRTGEQAWQDLQSGKGYVVSSGPDLGTKAMNIKSMFLAYLDYEEYQEYAQPVYVFIGEENFVAYVPAVSEEQLAQ